MQKQNILASAGQEVQRSDFNNVAQAAALADDVCLSSFTSFAEPSGSNPVRAILPTRRRGAGNNSAGTVSPSVSGVLVDAFVGIVGSRTAGAPQDIRSALFAGSVVGIGAQSAGVGTTRVDLIYATVYVDQLLGTVTRYQKDPTTKVNSPLTVAVQKRTYVTVSVAAGVASATPAIPALPSDPVGGYNVPLALISVPNGFSSISTPAVTSISDISPSISLTGETTPASAMHTVGSPFFDGITRSKSFMAAGTVGEHKRMFFVDTATPSINGAVIDDSVDWRKRTMTIISQLGATAEETAWHAYSATALPAVGAASLSVANSFAGVDQTIYSFTNGGGTVSLVVSASTGALKITTSGTPAVTAFFHIQASAQFRNV